MTIHYKTYGTGPRVVLGIHGWGGGLETFEPVAGLMPHDATIYAIDMPGYGESAGLQSWDVETLRAALVEFIDQVLPPGPVSLLGNCSGAVFGMLAVQARPERFDQLVLIDPFGYFPWYFRMMTWPVLGRFFYMFTFANPLGRLITNLSLASKRTDESHLTESFSTLNHSVVFEYLLLLRAIGPHTVFSDLRGQNITLAIGERTFGAIRNSVALWQQIWPESQVCQLEGAGHLPIQEATKAIAGLV